MRWARRALVIALFGVALYVCVRFPARNAEPVRVDYLAGQISEVSLWLALLGAFGIGALLAGLICGYQVMRLLLLNRHYRNTARGLEAELHELRNLPLAGAEAGGDVEAPVEPALERGV